MSDTITGYECTAHDFTCKGKAAAQMHMDLNRGCNLMPVRAGRTAEPAEPPHAGPRWEHDCEACIYLGSRSHYDYEYDLYVCPANKFNARPNLVARRGVMGEYVSGLEWAFREPILALAAIMALKAGYIGIADLDIPYRF